MSNRPRALHVSVVIPTYNEAGNVRELVAGLDEALTQLDAEIIFVDDSDDHTPDVVREVAKIAALPVRLIHRSPGEREGGLGGAVLLGIRSSVATWCLVMDGDMQHPPELTPVLLAVGQDEHADVVVASRYCGEGGDASGLANRTRRLVSSASTILTRAMFPRRLRDCTDPMTGFFLVRRHSIHLHDLQPRGFKILLEILARQDLRVVEEPFVFGARFAGESKASFRQGLHFLRQLASLRFGRMSRFAAVGAFGTVLNLAIMATMLGLGSHYLVAALIATELTILSNFLMQERLVFRDLRADGRPFWQRMAVSFGFNNLETLVRMPLLALLVSVLLIPSLLAQATLLAVAFLVRFAFTSRVIYARRRRVEPRAALAPVPALNAPTSPIITARIPTSIEDIA